MPEKKWIFDSVVLSNFLLSDSEHILMKRYGSKGVIAVEVYDEIAAAVPAYPGLGRIRTLLDKGHFKLTAMSPKERKVFTGLTTQLGRGEAASIALARNRGATVCTDDRAARNECARSGVAPTGTIGILKTACTTRLITPAQADRILAAMISNGFFSPVAGISALL